MEDGRRSTPWTRLPDESSRAYAAFCAYRDLGPERSIKKALQMSGKRRGNEGRWEGWSSKYRWVERARAYDDHCAEQRRIEHFREIAKMDERHVKCALGLQQAAVSALAGDEKTNRAPVLPTKPDEITRMLVEGVKLERTARGEPGETVGVGEIDFVERVRRAVEGAIQAAAGGPGDGASASGGATVELDATPDAEAVVPRERAD